MLLHKGPSGRGTSGALQGPLTPLLQAVHRQHSGHAQDGRGVVGRKLTARERTPGKCGRQVTPFTAAVHLAQRLADRTVRCKHVLPAVNTHQAGLPGHRTAYWPVRVLAGIKPPCCMLPPPMPATVACAVPHAGGMQIVQAASCCTRQHANTVSHS